tara:strand:- start:27 stop:539 length:513 start_codon:yes stop_codon:yes gene_type:complete
MENYYKKYLSQVEENNILKQDIKLLRNKLEKITSENCSMKIEIRFLKEENQKDKCFNNNGNIAIQELLRIFDEDKDITYMSHKQGEIENSWYSIYINSNLIFYLEMIENESQLHGLLTTPTLGKQTNHHKDIFKELTNRWENISKKSTRKKYDYRGKNILEVINIINQFR